jgi:hypothetical protein
MSVSLQLFGGQGSNWQQTYLHYGQGNGLQGNLVYSIDKDTKGYLWFSTDMGVSRYDGYQFRNYSTADGLTDNEVFGIKEDSKGRLWMMTRSGIPCFFSKDSMHNPTTDSFLTNIQPNGFLSAFYEDNDSNIYLGFYDGSIFSISPNLEVKEIGCSGVCRILGIGFGSKFGVYSVQNINWIQSISFPYLQRIQLSNMTITGSENYPVKFLDIGNGSMMLTWGKNLRIVDQLLNTRTYQNIIAKGKILGIFPGLDSTIHLATTNGAYHYRIGKLNTPIEAPVLTDRPVFSIYEDESSGTWYGTDMGVYFRPKIACKQLFPNRMGDRPTAIIFLPKGNLLVGFDDGKILEYDEDLQLIRQDNTDSFSVRSFHSRYDSEVWIRTFGGLYRRTANGICRIQNLNTRDLDFANCSSNTLAICNNTGLHSVDPNRYSSFLFGDSSIIIPKGQETTQCYCLEYDHSDELLVAASDGIYRLRGNLREHFEDVEILANYSVIQQILPLSSGPLFFGTAGNGLIVENNGLAIRLTTADGLRSNFVSALAEDSDGGVWVGGNNGLQWMDINGREVSSAEIASSILNHQRIHGLLVSPSRLVAASDDNVYIFDKAGLLNRTSGLHPQIETVTLVEDGSTIDQGMELDYENSSIQFDYVSISFLSSNNIQYRYRLLGLTETWNLTEVRFAKYPSLGPGDYTFQVQARLLGGKWADQTATFGFSIAPPYWKTWWFVFFSVLVSIAFLVFGFYLIYQNFTRRNLLMNRALVAEQKALITQMNPHFIFNTLNSIQYYYLTNDFENANEYLADFGALMRLILENGRRPRITISNEIEMLNLYIRLEQLRLGNNFDFEIQFFELNPDQTLIPPMILQPIVENAIWHGLSNKGERGRLDVYFRHVGDCLVITVEDDGIGRRQAAALKSNEKTKHESLATSITEERLEIMKKDFPKRVAFEIFDKVDSLQVGLGTIVTIKLPYETLMKSETNL